MSNLILPMADEVDETMTVDIKTDILYSYKVSANIYLGDIVLMFDFNKRGHYDTSCIATNNVTSNVKDYQEMGGSGVYEAQLRRARRYVTEEQRKQLVLEYQDALLHCMRYGYKDSLSHFYCLSSRPNKRFGRRLMRKEFTEAVHEAFKIN